MLLLRCDVNAPACEETAKADEVEYIRVSEVVKTQYYGSSGPEPIG
jgi:hypothetical protein